MKKSLIYLFFLFNFLTILFFWWSHSGPLLFQDIPNAFIALGRLTGLLAVYAVLTQFLLIGRAVWIEKTFGLDKLARIHRLNGHITIIFILLHPLFLTLGFSKVTKSSFLSQFFIFTTSYDDVLQALIAAILFLIIVFFSIYIVRRKLKYETWYYIHVFTYLAVFLAWGHQLKNGEDFLVNNLFRYYWYVLYIFVLGNHLWFRFLVPFFVYYKHKFVIEKIVHETTDVTSLYITGKNMNTFSIEAGQFMIFRFLTKELWWQAHPFSLSRLPDGKYLRVTVKNVGDFTSVIQSIQPRTKVFIYGPYGGFTEKISRTNNILLIAGGIGITPIRSLVEQMAKLKKNIVLIYTNKTKKDVALKNELDELANKYAFPIYYVYSQETTKDPLLSGRLDGQKIKTLVKDFQRRDIYICGPIPMTDTLRHELYAMGIPKSRIHFEKFAL